MAGPYDIKRTGIKGSTGSFGSIQWTDGNVDSNDASTYKELLDVSRNLKNITSVSASTTIQGGAASFASVTTAGAVVVGGDLTVNGTTTTVNSTAIELGDRIINLNSSNAAGDAGFYVNDTDTDQTGSLLWDSDQNAWMGGLKDAEVHFVDLSSAQTMTNKTLTSPDIDNADIDGGAIDGAVIGANTAAAASFTTVSASSHVSASSFEVDGQASIKYDSSALDFSNGGAGAKLSTTMFSASVELQGPTLHVSGAAKVGSLTLGGTAVTATAAELNDLAGNAVDSSDFTKLSEITATSDELNLLDAVTRGSIIHGNSSGASALLAKGAANTVLSSDGTDISYTQVSNDMLAGSITAAKMNNAIFEDLESLGAASSDGEFIVATGAGAFAYESGNTARTSLGLGTGDKPSFNEASASVGVFAPHVRLSGSTGIVKAYDTSKNDGTYVDLVSLNDSESMIVFDTEMGYGVRSEGGFDTGESGSLLSSNALEATNEAALRLASSTSTADNMEIDKAEAAVSVEFKSIGSGGIIFKDYDNDESIMTIVSSSAGGVAMDLKTGTIANLVDPSNAQDAATKAYVDAQLTGADLDFQGDAGGALSIDLDSEVLSIVGTTNEIETSGSGNQLKIGLPDDVTIGQDLTVTRDLSVTRNFAVNGNVDLGSDSSDSITANGLFDSHLIPDGATRNIGGAGSNQRWGDVYATNVYTGDFHMKNERGDWTLFEESDHIRIRNNATGQEFKLDMTPVAE